MIKETGKLLWWVTESPCLWFSYCSGSYNQLSHEKATDYDADGSRNPSISAVHYRLPTTLALNTQFVSCLSLHRQVFVTGDCTLSHAWPASPSWRSKCLPRNWTVSWKAWCHFGKLSSTYKVASIYCYGKLTLEPIAGNEEWRGSRSDVYPLIYSRV